MTQLMGRPILDLPSELNTRSALADLLTGIRTAMLALAVITVPVLGLWVLAPYADDTAQGSFRFACALWLLGHGAPLSRGADALPVTVTPLLLTGLNAFLLQRAGRRIGRRGRVQWRAPLALGAGYLAVAAGAVAECGGTDSALRSRPVPDLLTVTALTAAALWHGVRLEARTADGSAVRARPALQPQRVPDWAWAAGASPVVRRAAGVWLLGLVAAGGALLTVAVLFGEAARSVRVLGGGVAGLLGLLLACALLIPNAVLWAASYALGPGFRVGTGTAVAPGGTRLGAVPDFPLLALVPGPGGAGWWLLVCGLPLLAGVLPSLLLGRAAADRLWHPAATVLAALGAALSAGGTVALAAWAAGGALAGGRMSALGPVPWQAGLAAVGWLTVAAVPGALVTRWWHLRPSPPAWWSHLTRLSIRHTARPRAALHLALTWLSDLRLR